MEPFEFSVELPVKLLGPGGSPSFSFMLDGLTSL